MKYFVKQLGYESCDNEPYFGDFIDDNPEIIIDGGREFKSYNNGILVEIKKLIDEFYWLDNYYDNFSDLLWQFIRHKENGKRLSKREIGRIKRALEREDLSITPYEENVILEVLSVVFGKEYKKTGIRGSMQGDYVDCYVPNDMPQTTIDELEALYWNTGNEVVVDDSDKEEIDDADDIDGYCMYITDWNLKRGIAEALGCDEDDIVLFEFHGYRKVPMYKKA